MMCFFLSIIGRQVLYLNIDLSIKKLEKILSYDET